MARPPALDPLFRSLRSIKGVGPQLGALLNRFFGAETDAIGLDLLMHMPTGIVDRRRMEGVARTFVGHTATLRLHIGLENVEDLKADLERGFAALKAAT